MSDGVRRLAVARSAASSLYLEFSGRVRRGVLDPQTHGPLPIDRWVPIVGPKIETDLSLEVEGVIDGPFDLVVVRRKWVGPKQWSIRVGAGYCVVPHAQDLSEDQVRSALQCLSATDVHSTGLIVGVDQVPNALVRELNAVYTRIACVGRRKLERAVQRVDVEVSSGLVSILPADPMPVRNGGRIKVD